MARVLASGYVRVAANRSGGILPPLLNSQDPRRHDAAATRPIHLAGRSANSSVLSTSGRGRTILFGPAFGWLLKYGPDRLSRPLSSLEIPLVS